MQASIATNETRLPRAVLRRAAEIQAAADARSESEQPLATGEGASPEAAQPTTAEPQLQTPPVDPRESDPAYWKQRFLVTQGVLRTERDERKAQVVEFNQRLSEMHEQIVRLQAAPTSTAPDLGKYFTPEQVEELGEETCIAQVKMIERQIKDGLATLVEQEIKPLKEARQAQEVTAQADRKADFMDQLAELVPDFTTIDRPDTGFHDWLADTNDDGIVRQEILDRHVTRFDAPRVAAMFRAFQATRVVQTPRVTPHGSGAAAGTRSGSAAESALTPPSASEINAYYKRLKLQQVSEAERLKFEARLRLKSGG